MDLFLSPIKGFLKLNSTRLSAKCCHTTDVVRGAPWIAYQHLLFGSVFLVCCVSISQYTDSGPVCGFLFFFSCFCVYCVSDFTPVKRLDRKWAHIMAPFPGKSPSAVSFSCHSGPQLTVLCRWTFHRSFADRTQSLTRWKRGRRGGIHRRLRNMGFKDRRKLSAVQRTFYPQRICHWEGWAFHSDCTGYRRGRWCALLHQPEVL